MTKAYSMALKQQMISRLVGVNAISAAQLARNSGISQQNLSRWLSEARSLPFWSPVNGIVPTWTVEQKARIIAQASRLTGNELATYLDKEGVKPSHFRRWRLALEEAGEESLGTTKRIRKLERELIRKDRALAEAATLLVLREPEENQKEDDASGLQIEEEAELSYSMWI